MDRSAFQFSHESIKEFFLLTIYFLYMCLLREANITVSQSSSSIPISCLLARCINDVKKKVLSWIDESILVFMGSAVTRWMQKSAVSF